jgi:hypothetical protein
MADQLMEAPKPAVADARFGRLTVLGNASRRYHVLVRCDCGSEKEVRTGHLRSGAIRSCGCFQREARLKHGMAHHPICDAWRNMRCRCNKLDHPEYGNYGARGIRVCERWTAFEAFHADMGAGWRPGLTLERIDNDGHYKPGNCRWATRREQARNQRRNTMVDTPWGRVCLTEAAERSGSSFDAIWWRHHQGLPLFP